LVFPKGEETTPKTLHRYFSDKLGGIEIAPLGCLHPEG
jgi:hypothetical protein